MMNSQRFLALLVAAQLLAGCERQEATGHSRDEAPEADLDGDGLVRVSEAGIARSEIRTEPVRLERLVGGVDVPAEVQLNPNRTAHVTPMFAGQIAEVYVSLGDSVETSQALATMRSVALGETRSAVANARAELEVARANFVRQEELKREGIGSQRAYLEAQGDLRSAESDLGAATERLHVYGGRKGAGSKTTIRSPLSGTIIQRHATAGEVIAEGTALFMVSDLSRVWVVGRVYEQDIAAARVGAPALVSLQAYPGKVWNGEVSYVSHTLDPHTRTLDVRVELENAEGALKPGLFGRISLSPAGEIGDEVPVVPQDAVQRVGGQTLLFVATEEPGVFRPAEVTLGARASGRVEIRDGVDAGEQVVTSGAFILKSELLGGRMAHDHH